MYPVLIDFFGFFKLHTYGLMIAIAFLVGMQLSVREAKRVMATGEKDFDKFILDLTFWILIAAMVGARILFIIVEWDQSYARDPLKIIRIWEGGLVFYGGLIGAVLFSIYYSLKKGRNFFLVADMLIPLVALGQFFGRLGCFAAGCCWGKASDVPWAVHFPPGSLAYSSLRASEDIAQDAAHTMDLHPVQLYESTGTLLLFFLLLLLRNYKRFHGQILLAYMFLYPLLRTTLEFFRGDAARGQFNVLGFTLSTGQIVSILVAFIAMDTLVFVLIKRKRPNLLATPSV